MIAAAYYVVIATDAARRADEAGWAAPRPSLLARVRALLAALGGRAVDQPA